MGVSLTPYKICNFDCVYCQLGKTRYLSCERKEYAKTEDILEELRNWLYNHPKEAESLNYITLSGFGEPTLNINLGRIIQEIKKVSSFPVALITNSSLLFNPQIRLEISILDLIIPSLDAVEPRIFKKINQPHQDLQLEKIIEGLINLRKETKTKIWLEVMLIKKINDDLRHIKKLKRIIDLINPDKIQLNSPLRPTAEPGLSSVDKSKLKKIKDLLGETCEII
ncbi:MAG: radical SAM protein [Candidatus Omnitrophica bacterium]|nr:radical SAM protein [Candidatus Omnitrophota bacterium]